MTPSSSQSLPNQLNFGNFKGKNIIANFEGGKITSDAGIIFMAELDKKLKITSQFAECFRDYRDALLTQTQQCYLEKAQSIA